MKTLGIGSRPRRQVGWWRILLLSGASLVVTSGALRGASGDLRLVEAVKHQDKEAVRALLAQQVDVNTTQPDGATALHWAAYWDDLDTADRLIRAGGAVNAANEYGVTALSLACTNRNAAMVERLLTAGANPNAALSETGETVLMTCARTGSLEAVRALLARGADVKARESSQEQTALMWAVAQRHPEVVQVLIEHGAAVQARSRVSREVISRTLQNNLKFAERLRIYGTDAVATENGGFTPLLFAARVGDVASARHLLAAGANVNDTAADGTSVLVMATHSGHGALARFLLDRGANPNAASVGYTALHAAVLTGDLEVVKALLAHGARPNAQITQATRVSRSGGQVLMLGDHLLGATPFALAAKFVEVEIMRVLGANGADPMLPTKNGWTPVMMAAGAGWSYGSWDRRDRAILDLATEAEMQDEGGTLEAVKLAVALGADVNAIDEEGNTALHHVVDKRFNSVVEFLANAGARLDVKNLRGQTPLAMLVGRRGSTPADRALPPALQGTADLLRRLGAQD